VTTVLLLCMAWATVSSLLNNSGEQGAESTFLN
jgi:hypothetical protein